MHAALCHPRHMKPSGRRRTLGQRLLARAAGPECKRGELRLESKPVVSRSGGDTRRQGSQGVLFGRGGHAQAVESGGIKATGGLASCTPFVLARPAALSRAMQRAVQQSVQPERPRAALLGTLLAPLVGAPSAPTLCGTECRVAFVARWPLSAISSHSNPRAERVRRNVDLRQRHLPLCGHIDAWMRHPRRTLVSARYSFEGTLDVRNLTQRRRGDSCNT